ncbi:MAG: DUF695 domain-containing protein [Niabella sp.]|nr:DUF695 domain-containing protein [Niabella sp.]
MAEYRLGSDNLFFYSNDYADYPNEIDISIIHNDLTEENSQQIQIGVYIFLDNYLGELDFVYNIDHLRIISRHEAEKQLIPIVKLKEFLSWRQMGFVEKYEEVGYYAEDDEYSILEAELKNGSNLITVVNTQLLNWDGKVSRAWIAFITFKYDGSNHNGMPNKKDYESLNQVEESILHQLSDQDSYLYIGRQTANGERDIYFACKDFRKPSKVFFKALQENSSEFEIEYDIYKDKYWQSFERFVTA